MHTKETRKTNTWKTHPGHLCSNQGQHRTHIQPRQGQNTGTRPRAAQTRNGSSGPSWNGAPAPMGAGCGRVFKGQLKPGTAAEGNPSIQGWVILRNKSNHVLSAKSTQVLFTEQWLSKCKQFYSNEVMYWTCMKETKQNKKFSNPIFLFNFW